MSEPATAALPQTPASAPVLQHSAPGALPAKKAHIIVLGNEKGGSGKTTTGMHLIVALLRMGFTVGSMDIDARQRSLSRYLENRRQTMLKEGVTLPQPQHVVVQRSPFNIVQEAEADELERFTKALSRVSSANDFVVIDSPGSDTYLARVAHAYADTVITPINDSFVDLDVLATVDGQTMKIVKPSIYSEMMWEQKLQRAKRDGGSIEWIVMRNRLSNIDAKNKRFMTQVTGDLSRRIGFRVAPGFSERVIFREMFLQGLTVLDIMDAGKGGSLSLSHVAARQEVRDLLRTLKINIVEERLNRTIKEEEAKKSGNDEKAAEAKSDAQAEAKPEAKPEVKSDAQPEIKAAAKMDAKPETALEAKAEAKPEVKLESAPSEKPAIALDPTPELKAPPASSPVLADLKPQPQLPAAGGDIKSPSAPVLSTPGSQSAEQKVEEKPVVELAS